MLPVILLLGIPAAIVSGLTISLVLGLIHGATPDEHTWPITLSYSLGEGNAIGGAKAGFIFSLGFTVQRALLSELSFLVLAPFLLQDTINGIVYVIVGILMAIAGFYILRKGVNVHIVEVPGMVMHDLKDIYYRLTGNESKRYIKEEEEAHEFEEPRPVPLKFAFVHGLVAGFAFDAFALVVFTTVVAEMPNAYWGWLPGALFGIGTMIMQIIFGTLVGYWLKRKSYSYKQIAYIGRKTSGRVLAYGGSGFVLVGLLVITFPVIQQVSVPTGIPIPNLDTIDVGFLLVMAVIFIVAVPSYIMAVREVKNFKIEWMSD
jgi:hypothetical protein